ncbi:hypothetical protein L873DRAFT_1165256 [Choiromyces venosus 120613-1]|uniref:Uncharacterized protein n=1 Tax=Choiromyces venosus 120613-1 TaxID=1336337 RepID=A0A3N4JIB5_9PEZI|nr:hypothetical protein L873DRAFT_1165256 [Choiromyces venosus 120613-1]
MWQTCNFPQHVVRPVTAQPFIYCFFSFPIRQDSLYYLTGACMSCNSFFWFLPFLLYVPTPADCAGPQVVPYGSVSRGIETSRQHGCIIITKCFSEEGRMEDHTYALSYGAMKKVQNGTTLALYWSEVEKRRSQLCS